MSNPKDLIRVEISYKTILFATAIILGVWFIFIIREIIILTFLSIILVAALLKPVGFLHSKRVPRALAVLIVYLLLIVIISLIGGIIVPPLVSQTSEFVSNLPKIIETINAFLAFNNIPAGDVAGVLTSQINSIAGNIVSITKAVFSSIFSVVTMFVLSFYLLLEWKTFIRLISSLFSGKQERRVAGLILKVEKGLGSWVRGQLTLSIIIGVATYIGLTILGIPYALPLALVAGILEVIPLIGPIIAAIPAIAVGLTVSPVLGLAVVALFIIVQQLENHIVVPMVMSKVVGLQPAIVIIALLIGSTIAGIGGAFLAVPIILIIKIIIKDLLAEDQKFEENLIEE